MDRLDSIALQIYPGTLPLHPLGLQALDSGLGLLLQLLGRTLGPLLYLPEFFDLLDQGSLGALSGLAHLIHPNGSRLLSLGLLSLLRNQLATRSRIDMRETDIVGV